MVHKLPTCCNACRTPVHLSAPTWSNEWSWDTIVMHTPKPGRVAFNCLNLFGWKWDCSNTLISFLRWFILKGASEEKLTEGKVWDGKKKVFQRQESFGKTKGHRLLNLDTVYSNVNLFYLRRSHRWNMRLWRRYLAVPVIPRFTSDQEQPVEHRHQRSQSLVLLFLTVFIFPSCPILLFQCFVMSPSSFLKSICINVNSLFYSLSTFFSITL